MGGRRFAWRGSPVSFLFVTVFVDMIGYGIIVPLLPFYAQEYATGALLVGLLGSLYAAMQFVGGPFLGGLSDRYGRRPVLLTCLLGTSSLAYLTLGLAQTLTGLVLAVVLAGGASGTLATAQAYIADSTSPKDRARGLGLIGAAFGLGFMVGPALGGLLSLHSLVPLPSPPPPSPSQTRPSATSSFLSPIRPGSEGVFPSSGSTRSRSSPACSAQGTSGRCSWRCYCSTWPSPGS